MSRVEGRRENRLAGETSPYLLQHAENPVDWYPWGAEALERAVREEKPILLSVGYAACHWCHVMERESFEDDAIAALMNEHFVCIKVDREERPDIDELYMAATIAMSGHGGWPMTVFLTPDRQPFFAGTYFPPTDQYGRPGFGSLLSRIATLWAEQRADLVGEAEALTARLRERAATGHPASVAAEAIERAAEALVESYDAPHGGFGGAPKFPPCPQISLLLREHDRTGDERMLAAATGTLDGMKNGGIYDHLGGGFARYATDDRWLVPHFEKMLYDNAQLARVYLEAWQVTGNEEYARVARETLDYVVREMQSDEGGYYSATDADSEGEEGKYFVWTPESVDRELDEDEAEAFSAYHDVTPQGNWEGVSVLNTPRPLGEVARDLGLTKERLAERVARAKRTLLEARARRIPPLLDDKIIVSWNGLMIGAMAEGYRVLGDERYLGSAHRAARFVIATMRRPDGTLLRTARAGRAHTDAVLEDYAYLADALVDLYEAGGRPEGLAEAEALLERIAADFADPDGGPLFHTGKEHEALLVRLREGHDGALPNPGAVAARALCRVGRHRDRPDLVDVALGELRGYGRDIQRLPQAFCTALAVIDALLEPSIEVVLAGDREDPSYRALAAEVGRTYLPNRLVARAGDEDGSARTRDKTTVGGAPALYVCKNFTCDAPVTTVEAARESLARAREEARAARGGALPTRRLAGHATPVGTRRYAERHDAATSRTLGRTGLVCSPFGFGAYRVDDRVDEHRAALSRSLATGFNVVDTAPGYADGHSERLVGAVLAALVGAGTVARDEIVVVTKVGYAPRARFAGLTPAPTEIIDLDGGLAHCIEPRFIEAELDESLERLGLETVDVCLLHDPEELLSAAAREGTARPAACEEMARRLERAFQHLETEVARGRIRYYGISSDASGAPAGAPDALELDLVLSAAEAAGGREHHLAVLELPLNLLEAGALLELRPGADTTPALPRALKHGLGVLTNRPLSGVVGGRVIRLATPPTLEGAERLGDASERVRSLEREFAERLAPMLRDPRGKAVDPKQLLAWGSELGDLAASIDSYETWRDLERRALAPGIARTIASLDAAFRVGRVEVWPRFRAHYLSAIQALTRAIGQKAAARSTARLATIERALAGGLPEAMRSAPLAHCALAAAAAVPGVSVVLVGMRHPSYVDDVRRVASTLPLPANPRALFEALRDVEVPP